MSNYVDIVNKEKKEATIRLYGVIGKDVNGDEFAKALASLDEQVDTINLRINSNGGDVVQGFSIVSTILSTKAFVHVHVDGVAASMSAVIAVCGDKVSMMDFAKLMIHDAYFKGADSEKLSEKAKKALSSVTDSLRTILSRRGCEKAKIAQLMSAETWFSADEAKAGGLVDEVVSSKRKEEFNNLSVAEILARIGNEYKPINNENKMVDLKKITAELGLPEDASELAILDAIKKKETERVKQEKTLLDHYLALGVKNGTVTDKNKERMQKIASADFELFVDMITEGSDENPGAAVRLDRSESMTGNIRLSQALAELKLNGTSAKEAKDAKTWDWYQKNNPAALKKLERESPKEFEKLLNEYENQIV